MEPIKVERSGYVELLPFKTAEGGVLVAAESAQKIPFDIKRVFWITNLEQEKRIRGLHTHRVNDQVIFCIKGSFDLMLDDGVTKQTVTLSDPSVGVFLGRLLWHSMSNFSPDCVMLVLASTSYDKNDYIDSYEEFLELSQRARVSQKERESRI